MQPAANIIDARMSLDSLIDNLAPGASCKIGEFGNVSTWVERSGDGRTLRFVRVTSGESVVFRTALL